MKYMFINPNNGHCKSYHPFTSSKELTQDQAIKFIEMHGSQVYRTGSNLDMLIRVANDNGYDLQIYKCHCCRQEVNYISQEDYQSNSNYSDWAIIIGIGGNY